MNRKNKPVCEHGIRFADPYAQTTLFDRSENVENQAFRLLLDTVWKLGPAKDEIASCVATRPCAHDPAVSRNRVLDLAIEHEMVHATGLILGIYFKVDHERRRCGRVPSTLSRCSELDIQYRGFQRYSVGARIDDPAGGLTIPRHHNRQVISLTWRRSKIAVPGSG